MSEPFIYRPKPENLLKSWYNDKVRKGKSQFFDFADFKGWYENQTKQCHYCGLREEDSQKLVMTGLLTSNRFPERGKMSQGRCRGVWLEVDKIQPKGYYSRTNSVLCCYFCNNDKSDVFPGPDYKRFFQDRVGFLKSLLAKAKNVEAIAETNKLA